MTTTDTLQDSLRVDVAFCFFSGFGSEQGKPQDIPDENDFTGAAAMFGNMAHRLLNLSTVAARSTAIYRPYSVLPRQLDFFLQLFDRHQFVVPIGHSFGGAAVKWLTDQFHNRGIQGRVPIAVLFDGVPNTDRFAQFFPSQLGDVSEANRWGIFPDVAAKAVQIFQRVQLFPQGTQIRTIVPPPGQSSPSHWNKPAAEIGNPNDNHCDVVYDPAIQDYVVEQVTGAIQEAIEVARVGHVSL